MQSNNLYFYEALALIIGNYSIDGEVLAQSLKLDIDL